MDGAIRRPGLNSHGAIIDSLARLGYNEFELVAPTLRKDPLQLTEQGCISFRQAAEERGGRNAALHWALAGTDGYLTDSDPEVQERTAQIIVHLAKVIHWLGGDIIVHGSPLQRNLMSHMTYPEAFDAAVQVYAKVVPRIAELGVKVCIEQLTPIETNVFGSQPEVARFIAAVENRPGVSKGVLWHIIDTKALLGSPGVDVARAAELIREWGPRSAHCHLNDLNLYGPGCGEVDFGPLLQALYDVGFHQNWAPLGRERTVSVEVFKYDNLLQTAQTGWDTIATWQPTAAP
jgi:sugar phosphate isomerase/epimerase